VLSFELPGLDDFPGFLQYDLHFETPEEVRDRVVEAFDYMRVDTTDGFGFSLLCDNDTSMTRDTAFPKIRRTNSLRKVLEVTRDHER
jgi:hypothetical protein